MKQRIAALLALLVTFSAVPAAAPTHAETRPYAAEDILLSGSGFESAYMEWRGSSTVNYNVYFREKGTENYTKVDSELVRRITDSDYRTDIPGLKGGTDYEIKLEGDGLDICEFIARPKAYERSGFAFDSATDVPGAYNPDGTVPDNALIIYVTEENKKSVYKNKNIKSILSGLNSLNGGKPVIIRIIGEVTPLSASDTSPGMWKNTCGVTIEGIGTNSGLVGWGIGSGNNSDTEFRNLTFRDYTEDALGFEKSEKLWIHNNNFYSGYYPKDSSSEKDKLHGDGSCDLRECNKVTVSYNHFCGTDKTSLIGSSSTSRETTGNITFHHNYFDNTNQRTPRVRWHNIHVYNNYYYGTDSYAIGATCNSNIFAENNFFEDAASPFLVSSQGGYASKFSDNDGGVIKEYNNVMVNCRESMPGVDYFTAPSRDYRLTADDFITKKGNYTYNNFDQSGYIAENNFGLESPEAARINVIKNAGCLKETAIESMPDIAPPRAKGNRTALYYYDADTSGSASAFGGTDGTGSYFTGSINCKSNTASGYRGTESYKYSGSFSTSGKITFTTNSQAKLTMIASSTANSPVRMEVTNTADPDAVYHGTFQSGSGGNDVVTVIDLLRAGTYTISPKSNVDFYYIEVEELDGTDIAPVIPDYPEPETFIYGDTSGDGNIDAEDSAIAMQRALVGTYKIPLQDKTENWLKYADVDPDGSMTAADSAAILQKALVSTYKMPVEKNSVN